MSNYWKKRLDELNGSKSSSGSSSDYWGSKLDELKEEEQKKKSANTSSGGTAREDPMDKLLSSKKKKEEDDDSSLGFVGDVVSDLTGVLKKAGKNTKKAAKKAVNSLDFLDSGALKDGFDWEDLITAPTATVGDAALSAAKGFARVGEGIGDLAVYGLAYGAKGLAKGAKAVGLDELAWNLEGTATDWKYGAQENVIDDLTMDWEKSLDKYSFLGKTSNAILEGVGQIGAITATGGAGELAGLGAVGTQALTTGTMFGSSMGSGISEAYQSGATDGEAAAYGLIAGASDTITEMLFGGLGKSLNVVGFGKGLSSADDMLAKKVSSKISNQIAKNWAEFGIKAGAEGFEEVLAGVAQAAGKKATYMSEEDFGKILEDENLLEQFVVGAVTSGIAQSGYIPGTKDGSLRDANKSGKDFITGFTANDQTVFDKVVEDRIAEQEKDGKKLTRKEKAAIEAEVNEDLKKGRITTDTIESILGGETYKAYKETVDKENSLVEKQKALLDEYNKLDKDQQSSRLAELSKQLQDLQAEIDNPQSKAQQKLLKAQLSKSVYELTKNDSLRESYLEVVRGQQKFEADLSQYKGRARDVIQKVMDSKLADNSNQTHEFWDWAANMSSSMDTDITLATNEQILDMVKAEYKENGWEFDESKFEGQVIDGYVSKNGIVLNASSKRALNFVVGHEITHKLEKTKHYGKLQKLLFEYAKGEYESRYNERKGQYSNKFEADENFKKKVDQEVTGDLVGDYVFNDKGFIDHLAKDRNVFMRVWDEIKYMAKIATAGSEQAKQLEKVKREFERAYREMQKNTADNSGVQLSIETLPDGKKYVRADRQVIFGNDPDSWSEQVEDYINGKIRNGENISLVAEDGDILVLTAKTAGKLSDNHTSHGTTMSDDDFYLKATAAVHIDELAQVSTAVPGVQRTDEGARHGDFAKNGWTYRTAYFLDFDKKYYRLRISAAMGADGTVVYNIGDVKERNFPTIDGSSAKSGALGEEVSSGKKVPQKGDSVKPQFSLSDKNIKDVNTGYAYDEYYYTMSYEQDGKVVGTLEYGVYEGKPNVKMIEVSPEYRRKGIGTKLLQELQKKYDGKEIEFGMRTTDGAKLLDSITYDVTDEAVVADRQKLKDLQTELDDLEAKMGTFDELFDSGTITEAQRAEFETLGERWDEVYHSINELEPALRGKKETKTFVKTEPTADSDVQFSLSKSVEQTKDLVALHNLTADKLLKSLELGGLPMPSLAVTKSDIPHSNFGDISLIFGRETIDPKANKKNKVYSADAWTPVFPRVEYEADSKVANSVSQKLSDLGGKIDDYFQRDLNRVNHGFEHYLNSDGGEEGLVQRVMDNYGMKAAYLEDSGKHIETVTTQQEAEKNFNPDSADKYQKVMDILGVTTAEEIGKVNLKDAIDNHGAELETVYPGITKTAMRMGRLFGIVQSYIESKDAAPVYNTVVDGNATRKAVDDALDTEGYEAWVRNLFTGIVKDSGIYNNKDIFTPSGNRRSFKQTHLPVTLENIVKAMAGQNNGNAKNVSGFNGIKTLRAATAETFKSVDEMHQKKGRLQNRTQEEADALNNELQTRLYKVMEAIDNESGQFGGDNPFIRLDSIGEVLTEIGESGNYGVADIQSVFKQYGRDVSDDTALEVKQLLYDVTQMPVNIFEAKPQRVVGFDEAKVFVIPRNADIKLKQELLNRGYNIAEYDPDVEGDRQKVVNQFEEYKFSLSDVGQNFRDTGGYKYYSRSATPATELRFEAPVAEDIAPVTEVTQEAEVTEAEMQELFPDDLAPTQQTLESLLDRKTALESEMLKMGESGDFSNFENINAEYEKVQNRIAELEADESDRFSSLDDADAPPVREVYHDELPSHDDPFADRNMSEVGNRKVKAYMYENPEVKPFFQAEANVMLGDLYNSTKGERWYNDELYYASGGEKGWGGTSRNTTDDIAELLDQWHYTYADIENGLKAIIEDHGAENNACSKRIEFMLNDRLLNGYKAVDGRPMPANQEYKNLLKEKNITEYNKGAFDSLVAHGDDFAPMAKDFAPAAESPVDNAPVAEIYDTQHKKGVVEGQQAMWNDPVPEKVTRKVLHERILDNVKSTFSNKGFDFDKVLKKAKNLSTFATVDNIPQRVMEKALGYKEGQILSDITVNKVAQNETEGIKWLNSFTDRKNGLLANISKQYHIKPGSKKSAAAQMYAEGFYVNENNEIIQYGDRELAMDFPDAQDQKNIKGLARDPRIRKIYDDTLAMINESRTRNAYPEIPRLDNYFLHFRAMDDTFSKLGLPFNPNDIRAKDLPTDLNGVTADLKPGQPYFASAMHRTGKRTSFDLLGGLERYLTSAKNQIYHIDDIQTLRALRNYIADTYGQANGLEGLDVLSEEEAQDRIEKVYNSHLSTFAKFLNEEANILAGKTALIDRGLEGIIGRRGITTLNTINQQVGKNMVGLNISSSLTNFLPVMQTIAKTNKFDFVKGLAQTAANKVGSIFGRGDGFAENSPVIIRRKGAESFYRTPWQKAGDAGYVLMSAVDDISTELIARTKYNELTRKGMDSQKAHIETDKWVSRLMGDRSLGQMPQLYNSKMLGLITKFQLEVRNQLDSQFYDTIQEAKVSTEDIQNGLLRNAKKAAKIGATFFELAVIQHMFGMAFESVAGYNPAFDIIEVISKMFGWDDDEEDEDTVLDNIEEGFLALLEDLPYTSTLTGGRIPISSALPIEELVKGEDQYGNEKSRWETLGEIAPYYLLPGGYGQIKKTAQGLSMFDDDLPIAGSYTDSGNLRFPVEDTVENRIKAGVFGQWANENARNYFDNERSPLKPKQIDEFIDLDIPIADYWEIREGMSGLTKLEEKADYIEGLDLPTEKKNILINNIADRKEPIDMEDYGDYSSFEEFDFAEKNPEKYKFLERNGISYQDYSTADEDTKAAYNWAYENPEKHTLSKAITDDVVEYRKYTGELYDIRADKDSSGKSISGSAKRKKLDYINNLDLSYGQKIILFKSLYEADDTYNYEIVEYLNNRDDISYKEMETILKELGFRVDANGNISW